jgi:hypothetical protein
MNLPTGAFDPSSLPVQRGTLDLEQREKVQSDLAWPRVVESDRNSIDNRNGIGGWCKVDARLVGNDFVSNTFKFLREGREQKTRRSDTYSNPPREVTHDNVAHQQRHKR